MKPSADPTKGGKYWFCAACGARMFWRHSECVLCETPAPPDIAARAAAAPPYGKFMALMNSQRVEYALLVVVAIVVIGTVASIRGVRWGLDVPTIVVVTIISVIAYLVWLAASHRQR